VEIQSQQRVQQLQQPVRGRAADASSVCRLQAGDRVWVSRDPRRAGGTFAEFIAVTGQGHRQGRREQREEEGLLTVCLRSVSAAARELSPAPARLPLSSSACYPFIWTTLWTALVDRAAVEPVPVSRLLSMSSRAEDEKKEDVQRGNDSESPPARLPPALPSPQPQAGQPAAFVHGAGGPLGRLAVQTLQRWGFHVTATLRPGQETAGLRQHAAAVITTQPSSQSAASSSLPAGSGSWSPPLPSSLRPPSWLPSSCARAGFRLFLDCVGGGSGSELSEGEEAAAVLLQPGVGCYVTLRGRMVQDVDERGLLAGGWRAVAGLLQRKAAFAARGLRYEAAVNACNARALHYLALCLDTGGLQHYDSMQQQDHSWTGIERVIDALQHFDTNRPQAKCVVSISDDE
jgi:hypothetical protein